MASNNTVNTAGNPNWKKGMVPSNPGGKPKEKPFTEALTRQLYYEQERRLPRGATNLEAIVAALIRKARSGDAPAIKEVVDRIEGKPTLSITGDVKVDILLQGAVAELNNLPKDALLQIKQVIEDNSIDAVFEEVTQAVVTEANE